MASRLKKLLLRLLVLLVVFYLGIVVLFTFIENSIIFQPSRYPTGNWELVSHVQDVWFDSADGTKLHGWFRADQPDRPVVLFCHGNGGSIAGRRHLLGTFANLQVSALIFDYRGYGRSHGSPNEKGILADARAARTWLAKQTNVSEDQIVIWGESLGGAVAVDLAADGARGLILENTFCSLQEVAKCHFPWLPIKWCMKSQLNSGQRIVHYRGPLLQFHGDVDSIVPYKQGQKLFERANEPKTFCTIEGGSHNDGLSSQSLATIRIFINELP